MRDYFLPRRDALFKISGIRGGYPQFFIVEDDDIAIFLGQWLELESILTLEHEMLSDCLGVDFERQDATNEYICDFNQLQHKKEISSAANHERLSKDAELTVLVSNGVFDRTQHADQNAALQLLRDLNIPFNLVDGMNAENAKR